MPDKVTGFYGRGIIIKAALLIFFFFWVDSVSHDIYSLLDSFVPVQVFLFPYKRVFFNEEERHCCFVPSLIHRYGGVINYAESRAACLFLMNLCLWALKVMFFYHSNLFTSPACMLTNMRWLGNINLLQEMRMCQCKKDRYTFNIL